MKKKIIIDTDPGHDDALAFMLMIKSGLFDIRAITTVAGNSTIENVTRNAAYILSLLERTDIPIFSGKPVPLQRTLIQAVVHGTSGLDGVDTSHVKYVLTRDADERLVEIIRKNPGMTLLTLGPLTNIARALMKDPTIVSNIQKIVMMGGAIDVPGNKNRVAEFNMFVDPEAADIVFKTEISKVLIPIDVCNDMPVFLSDFEKLNGSTLYQPIMDMMKQFIAGLEKDEGVRGALVYDAVAAYYLVNPSAFTLEKMDIVIETKGEYTFGMTVAEKRLSTKKQYNVEVVRTVDRQKFTKEFIDILKK